MYFKALEEITETVTPISGGNALMLRGATIEPIDTGIGNNQHHNAKNHDQVRITHALYTKTATGEKQRLAVFPTNVLAENGGTRTVFTCTFDFSLPEVAQAEDGALSLTGESLQVIYDGSQEGYIGTPYREAEPLLDKVKHVALSPLMPNYYADAIDQGLIAEADIVVASWIYTGVHTYGMTPYADRLQFFDFNALDVVIPLDFMFYPEVNMTFGQVMHDRFKRQFGELIDLDKFNIVAKDQV
jgi:hypothetical protein